MVYEQTSFKVCFDTTFDPEVVLGHYDLISWFSDFALYLGTQLAMNTLFSQYE